MHHLEDEEKVKFIEKLENYLNKDGKIIIGDIVFETKKLLEECKVNYNEYWDDEEVYFVFEDLRKSLLNKNISFTEISHCSGVIQISKS
jgi:putative AdoMet-dependent methyltransferase